MPIQRRAAKSEGIYGIGQCRVTPTVLIVTMDDVGTRHKKGDQFEFGLAELRKKKTVVQPGRWRVAISGNGERFFGMSPLQGTYYAKFVGIKRKDDVPEIRYDQNAKNSWNIDQYVFTAIFEITTGPAKGMEVSRQLVFSSNTAGFVLDRETNETFIKGTGKVATRLSDFLVVCGMDFDQDTLPALEGSALLSALEEDLLGRGRIVLLTLNDKGFVDNMAAPPSDGSRKVAKKAAPKTEVKKAKPAVKAKSR